MRRRWVSSLGFAFILVISLLAARSVGPSELDLDLGAPAIGSRGAAVVSAAFSGTPTVALPVEQVASTTLAPLKQRGLHGIDLPVLLVAAGLLVATMRLSSVPLLRCASISRPGRVHPGRGPPRI